MKSSQSFTLIELVIVIGILAVMAAVAIIVINPAEYMKSTRDSQRQSELQTITKAIGLYLEDGKSSIGTSNIVYVSILDSSATCSNLGLPFLPAGWSYQCATEPNYRKTDGTGWIPIAFNTISFGNTLDTLPVDPTNTTSSLNYYTYITGGSFELTAAMESSKYKMGGSNDITSKDNGSYPELYEMGFNLTLLPVNYGDTSLVGYWKFDEGSGTTAYDASRHGNNGTIAVASSYITGKVGSYALNFDGVNNYVSLGTSSQLNPTNFTITAWINWENTPNTFNYIYSNSRDSSGSYNGIDFSVRSPGGSPSCRIWNTSAQTANSSLTVASSTWIFVGCIYNGAILSFSRNTTLSSPLSTSLGVGQPASYGNYIGSMGMSRSYVFKGYMDDVRLYNRALSAAEIQAMYTATNK